MTAARPLFNVTYERIDESESTAGDTTRRGFLDHDLTLAGALLAIHRDTPAASENRGSYASDSEPRGARWYSVEIEEWESGDHVTYSVHFPSNTTPASRARLCRVLARAF